MTDTTPPSSPLPAEAIADWLREHPEFFDDHADVFAELQVPHPHTGRAVSLGERQVVTLRERLHVLERQISTLTRTARVNQQIAMRLYEWSLGLLSETETTELPARVCSGLREVFGIPDVALRLWQCTGPDDSPWRQAVSEDARLFAESLSRPYCGRDTRFEAVGWLAEVPASLALVALRTPQRGQTFGLLVLGADDETRFTADMGTIFLEQVGAQAGAALSRLLAPPAAG
ncbi:MAG: DUF484 family protein [Pigmentiphaga sp.]|nr:DUF484 family protein [Pigmentiphaga sp.]